LLTNFIALLLTLATGWAAAALYFDLRTPWLRIPLPALYLLLDAAAVFLLPTFQARAIAVFVGFLLVLIWWRSIKPSNDRIWQPDVAQTAWAELDGDIVTIHNFRQCEYRKEFDYDCSWVDKQVRLSEIRGVDLFITYWGSSWIAHPITSFQIGENDHVAFSIDVRKELHERFSSIRGFFRSYELYYAVSTEDNLVRLRTNFRRGAKRQGEDVYLYRTTAGPDWSRLLFLAYIYRINELHTRAEWYNAVTSNCTTNIFNERNIADNFVKAPSSPLHKLLNRFDWRILLNGKGDKMEYQRGDLETGGLSFVDLKRQAHINEVARQTNDPEGFSERIRRGRVGF
jgi:uncharacterized protein DUF4105